MHRADVPIQAVGDSADGDDGTTEPATCSDDGVVVKRGADQGIAHPSFECREPVREIACLQDSLMELPSARRDVAQERCAIQELESGTAEYGMPSSRSQPDPGYQHPIAQLHASRRGIGCCNHRRMIVADDNVGAAVRQDQIARRTRVEADDADPGAGHKGLKVGRRWKLTIECRLPRLRSQHH